jgi:hypothetical protein
MLNGVAAATTGGGVHALPKSRRVVVSREGAWLPGILVRRGLILWLFTPDRGGRSRTAPPVCTLDKIRSRLDGRLGGNAEGRWGGRVRASSGAPT